MGSQPTSWPAPKAPDSETSPSVRPVRPPARPVVRRRPSVRRRRRAELREALLEKLECVNTISEQTLASFNKPGPGGYVRSTCRIRRADLGRIRRFRQSRALLAGRPAVPRLDLSSLRDRFIDLVKAGQHLGLRTCRFSSGSAVIGGPKLL